MVILCSREWWTEDGCGISAIGTVGSWERRTESEGRACFEKCSGEKTA